MRLEGRAVKPAFSRDTTMGGLPGVQGRAEEYPHPFAVCATGKLPPPYRKAGPTMEHPQSPRKILRDALQWPVLPIWAGPLRGKLWTVGSCIRFLRGTYEPEGTAVFQEQVKEGQVVYDIGAHVGYYTVLGSMAVGPQGRVIAFEPFPFNLRQLRRHIRLNRCDNVTVVEKCVGDRSGRVRFAPGSGTGTGRVAPDGPLEFDMLTLDEAVAEDAFAPPDFMRIDVEGAELSVLEGAREVIARSRPAILLSLHGEHLERDCSGLLTAWGYRLEPIKTTRAADTEMLATPQS